MNEWVQQNGKHEAVAKVIKKTGLSASTVDKMLGGRYDREPNLLLRKALAELTKFKEEDLFPESKDRTKVS